MSEIKATCREMKKSIMISGIQNPLLAKRSYLRWKNCEARKKKKKLPDGPFAPPPKKENSDSKRFKAFKKAPRLLLNPFADIAWFGGSNECEERKPTKTMEITEIHPEKAEDDIIEDECTN